MRQGASSTSFCDPLKPAFMKTAWRSLPKLEVMPQLSTLDLAREAACQLEPTPPTNPDLHQKLICLLSAADFLPTGIIVREMKIFRKISSFPFSALLLCQVQIGRNGQLASAKPFLGHSQSHQKEAGALQSPRKEAFSRATPG